MRKFLLVLVVGLTIVSTATAAITHTPFKDGPATARQMAKTLNHAAMWDQVVCRYARPHIRCNGILKTEPRTDVWYRFTMTVHKTAARHGYSMTCVTVWAACRRQELKFAV